MQVRHMTKLVVNIKVSHVTMKVRHVTMKMRHVR
jgi:hypothetical protein